MNTNDILHLDSRIDRGPFKNKTIKDIINNKKEIFRMIKEGYYFDDDVLQAAGITKTIKNSVTSNQVVEHEKDTKQYEVDTTPLQKILKELATIDNYSFIERTTDANEEEVIEEIDKEIEQIEEDEKE